jgi:hypothetical protein
MEKKKVMEELQIYAVEFRDQERTPNRLIPTVVTDLGASF